MKMKQLFSQEGKKEKGKTENNQTKALVNGSLKFSGYSITCHPS